MHHLGGRHPLKLEVVHPVVGAWVEREHLVGDHVADSVKLDPVDDVAFGRDRLTHELGRRRHHLGLDEPDVELHTREPRVVHHEGEGFAVDDQGLSHRAELAGEIDRPRPIEERPLDLAVDLGVAAVELQPGAGADQIVGERRGDAGEKRVVGPLVAGAVAERPPDAGREGGIGRKCVGVGPVPHVVAGRGGVVLRTHARGHRNRCRSRLREDVAQKAHLDRPRRDQLVETQAAAGVAGAGDRRLRGEVLVGFDDLVEIVGLDLAGVGADPLGSDGSLGELVGYFVAHAATVETAASKPQGVWNLLRSHGEADVGYAVAQPGEGHAWRPLTVLVNRHDEIDNAHGQNQSATHRSLLISIRCLPPAAVGIVTLRRCRPPDSVAVGWTPAIDAATAAPTKQSHQ